jgi:hypothetical protein
MILRWLRRIGERVCEVRDITERAARLSDADRRARILRQWRLDKAQSKDLQQCATGGSKTHGPSQIRRS